MTTKVLTVPDISCEHCERAIKGALEPLPGVQVVHVDIPGKKVRVQYDETRVDVETIKAAVEEEEYPVAAVE
ncbi:MAG TPA: heavy-metal-associated domain-containing protein [Chloroflexota bacterium]|nr:heavy-metal-associated domain-containing protein [Chloroflexota bacterium]